MDKETCLEFLTVLHREEIVSKGNPLAKSKTHEQSNKRKNECVLVLNASLSFHTRSYDLFPYTRSKFTYGS